MHLNLNKQVTFSSLTTVSFLGCMGAAKSEPGLIIYSEAPGNCIPEELNCTGNLSHGEADYI